MIIFDTAVITLRQKVGSVQPGDSCDATADAAAGELEEVEVDRRDVDVLVGLRSSSPPPEPEIHG